MATDKLITEQLYMDEEKETLAVGRKNIFFVAFIFLACLSVACLKFFYQHSLIPVFELAAFIVLGCICAVFMRSKTGPDESFSYSLFISAALAISLLIIYFFKKTFTVTDIIFLVAAFLLPNIIAEAWRVYLSQSFQEKPTWTYSNDIPDQPLFVYLENKPVRIELLIGNESPIAINAVAPLSLKLGMALFYILKKEAEVNAGQWKQLFVDPEGKPYQWVFYSKSFGMVKTFFQPEETLVENRIRSNTVIVAKRIE